MIRLENITKSYQLDNPIPVLKGINLHIRKGEGVAILGSSGSGKSTLLHVVGLIHVPTSGRILVDGIDAGALSDDERSRLRGEKLGFVFQAFHLLPQLSVLENVMLPLMYQKVGAPERQARAEACLEKVGLSHRLTHRPSQLSGGECQRVAIARAIVSEPDVLMADEPTGNLDKKTGEQIMELIQGMHAAGKTLIMITHDPAVAQRMPRQVVLSDGMIKEDTGHADR